MLIQNHFPSALMDLFLPQSNGIPVEGGGGTWIATHIQTSQLLKHLIKVDLS